MVKRSLAVIHISLESDRGAWCVLIFVRFDAAQKRVLFNRSDLNNTDSNSNHDNANHSGGDKVVLRAAVWIYLLRSCYTHLIGRNVQMF